MTDADERAERTKAYMDYDPKKDPRNAWLLEQNGEVNGCGEDLG